MGAVDAKLTGGHVDASLFPMADLEAISKLGFATKEGFMKKALAITVVALGYIGIAGTSLAQEANDGVPYGQGVVSGAAQVGRADPDHISHAVAAQGPGNVDDKVASNLGDNEIPPGNVRGHGRTAARGNQPF